MRVMHAIALAVIAAGMAGCATDGDVGPYGQDVDGPRCDSPLRGDRVHIEVRYAGDGTPSAVPDECTVAPGTRITWRGPADNATVFDLAFPGGSPEPRGGRDYRSGSVDARQKVGLVAAGAEGRYKYAIAANGIAVDPAIIIKR